MLMISMLQGFSAVYHHLTSLFNKQTNQASSIVNDLPKITCSKDLILYTFQSVCSNLDLT